MAPCDAYTKLPESRCPAGLNAYARIGLVLKVNRIRVMLQQRRERENISENMINSYC